jgi:hypothetical protein
MIRREWNGDFIVIAQPDHARLSGALAKHWGAGEFVRPEPWEEVLLATAEHDGGWKEWEERPTLDADNLLVNFNRTSFEVTIENFRRSVQKLYDKGHPYAAALVSRHAVNVYALMLRLRSLEPADRARIDSYVSELEGGQEKMLRELSNKPEFKRAVTKEAFYRNARFVTALDLLALILCNGWTHLDHLEEVPIGEDTLGEVGVKWDPGGPEGMCLQLTPWPYQRDSLEESVQGCRIPGHPFDSEEDLHAALREAPPFEMNFRVIPG